MLRFNEDLKKRVLNELNVRKSTTQPHPSGKLHSNYFHSTIQDLILPETLEEKQQIEQEWERERDWMERLRVKKEEEEREEVFHQRQKNGQADIDQPLDQAEEVMDRYGLWKPEIFVTKEHKVILMEPRGLCEGCFETRSNCLCDIMATFEIDRNQQHIHKQGDINSEKLDRPLTPNRLIPSSPGGSHHSSNSIHSSHLNSDHSASSNHHHSLRDGSQHGSRDRFSTWQSHPPNFGSHYVARYETVEARSPSPKNSSNPSTPRDGASLIRSSSSSGEVQEAAEKLLQSKSSQSRSTPNYAAPTLSALLKTKHPTLLMPK